MTKELKNWCALPTSMGEFRIYDTGNEGVRVVCIGDLRDQGVRPLLRVHSSCLASEIFGATDCDCADQLRESMKRIANEGRGMIFHLHQEGRGHGLSKKIQAVHTMQRDRLDTVEAFESLGLEQDIRDYEAVIFLLKQLGISSVRLISNNPAKSRYLQQRGIQVEMVNTHPKIRPENADYLLAKNAKLGHRLPLHLSSESNGTIYFYHSDQPWGEFSNFSQHAVFLRGKIWPTVEHFYQAHKFAGTEYEEIIRLCPTPTLAKRHAKILTETYRRQDWDSTKRSVMLEGLRAKFDQHPELLEQLLSSGDRVIVEHTEHDRYWGDAGDGTGLNMLGRLLMQIRSELRRSVGNIEIEYGGAENVWRPSAARS